AAGSLAGRFLGGGRRLRRRGLGGRRLEFVEQIAKLAFERQHPCFQLRIAGQQYAAPGALGNVHAANIANSPAISCASFESVNGYFSACAEVCETRANGQEK